MSKSLKRVRAALEAAGIPPDIREPGETRTAEQAAAAAGCALDQIVKSIIFQGHESGRICLDTARRKVTGSHTPYGVIGRTPPETRHMMKRIVSLLSSGCANLTSRTPKGRVP